MCWRGSHQATAVLVIALMATLAMSLGGVAYRLHECFGGGYDRIGASAKYSNSFPKACLTDLQGLWATRGFYTHEMLYVHVPPNSPNIGSGGLEYPVLTGLAAFLAEQPVTTDRGFFLTTAALLVPLLLIATTLLVRLVGRRALLFAFGTPVMLYAVYNWDAIPVMFTVCAIWAWSKRDSPATVATRSPSVWYGWPLVAGVMIGLGTAAKLYPLIFALPMLLDGLHSRDRRSMVGLVAGGAAAWMTVNIPFVLIDFSGWKLTYLYQRYRSGNIADNSIWWYLHLDGRSTLPYYTVAFVLIAIALAAWVWWMTDDAQRIPWLPMCGAILAVFLLANEIFSLQYDLWLLPFFAFLAIPVSFWVGFCIFDVACFVSFFRPDALGRIHPALAGDLLQAAVWGRTLMVGAFLVLALRAIASRRVSPSYAVGAES
jgi:uncharacterized membrane protein